MNILSFKLFFSIFFTLLVLFGHSQKWLIDDAPLQENGSNLPVFVVTTSDYAPIPDDPKIDAHLGIVNSDDGVNFIDGEFNEYDGLIGIELRGQSSLRKWDKTSYGIETRKADGENNNITLFDFAKENDWVLNACMYDRSFIRMPLTYQLSRKMGRYASKTKFCEVFVNDDYRGLYIFMEKIKRDNDRVVLSEMTPSDISGNALTGGYLFEYSSSRWGIPAHFEFHYPKKDDVTPEQQTYVYEYMDNLLNILKSDEYDDPEFGYKTLIDVPSFVDEIIIQEITKSQDAYRYSSYFSKDRGKKLKAGPVWDFDQSFGNSTSHEIGGFMITEVPHELIWPHLFQIQGFKLEIGKRWKKLRIGPFKTDSLLLYIDKQSELIYEAQKRNFNKWDVLGEKLWREPDALIGVSYSEEVDYMKNWIVKRCNWLDNYFETIVSTHNVSSPINSLVRYSSSNKTISISIHTEKGDKVEIQLMNLQGQTMIKKVQNMNTGSYNINLPVYHIPTGIYCCNIKYRGLLETHKVLVNE